MRLFSIRPGRLAGFWPLIVPALVITRLFVWNDASRAASEAPAGFADPKAVRELLMDSVVRDRGQVSVAMDTALAELDARAASNDPDAKEAIGELKEGHVAFAATATKRSAMALEVKDRAGAVRLWQVTALLESLINAQKSAASYAHTLDLAPDNVASRYGLAVEQEALGRDAEARANFAQVVAATTSEPHLFYQYWARLRLTHIRVVDDDTEGVAADLATLEARIGDLCARDPSYLAWERDLAVAQHLFAQALVDKARFADALAQHRRALSINERLVAADSSNQQQQRDLAYGQQVTAAALVAAGDRTNALATLRRSMAIVRQGIALQPGEIAWRRDGASVGEKIADLLVVDGHEDEASALLRESIGVAEWLGRVVRDRSEWFEDLARREDKLATLLQDKKHDLAGAIGWYDSLRSIRAWLARTDPTSRPRRLRLALAYRKLAAAHALNADPKSAFAAYRHALDVDTKLFQDDPNEKGGRLDLAVTLDAIGDTQHRLGNEEPARKAYARARDIRGSVGTVEATADK